MPASHVNHGHDHSRDHGRHAVPTQPGFSLLRLSAPRRIAGALAAVAVLWGLVFWAVA